MTRQEFETHTAMIMGTSIEEAREFINGDSALKKYVNNMKEIAEIETEIDEPVEEPAKPKKKTTRTRFKLNGEMVSQEIVFLKWFETVNDNAQVRRIKKYLAGESKGRTNQNGYLNRAKISDIKVFVILFNMITDDTLELVKLNGGR